MVNDFSLNMNEHWTVGDSLFHDVKYDVIY
jgi:hypothetical protein